MLVDVFGERDDRQGQRVLLPHELPLLAGEPVSALLELHAELVQPRERHMTLTAFQTVFPRKRRHR